MNRQAIGMVILAALALAMPENGQPVGVSHAAGSPLRLGSSAAFGNMERRIAMDWATGKCDGVTRVEGLDGQTDAQITESLGEPERKETFRLGERPDEFHISLQNHYPLKNILNRDVKIQEWTWTNGPCRLTVWLHTRNDNWLGFENIRYPTAAEF